MWPVQYPTPGFLPWARSSERCLALAVFILLGGTITQTNYLFAALAIAAGMIMLARYLNHREALATRSEAMNMHKP